MAKLSENSVDAIICDPPYGLSFMGKKWDYDVPSVAIWKEALRVLKPGGHLLSFGGTRTYHRLVCNIEDAGFEIKDQIQWIYGSGFPKSLDVSKAIDKAAGAEREKIGFNTNHRSLKETNCMVGEPHSGDGSITAPSTDLAKQWSGWGTALKPANEPICVARKPLDGTVAHNVEKWGTGAINVDASRINVSEEDPNHRKATGQNGGIDSMFGVGNSKRPATLSQGRWPANVIFDEEAAAMLDEQSGILKSGKLNGETVTADNNVYGKAGSTLNRKLMFRDSSLGGASRFFYCPKTSKSERNAGLEGMPEKIEMNEEYLEIANRRINLLKVC